MASVDRSQPDELPASEPVRRTAEPASGAAADRDGDRRGEPTTPTVSGGAADYLVLTPERVTLQFDLAGVGSRSAAALVDVALQSAALALLLLLFGAGAGVLGAAGLNGGGGAATAASIGFALVVLSVFLILWGYYIFFEIVWSGQTPGKRALGIRVLRENGYPLRPGDAVVRNLVRILDGPPLGAAIGLLVMLFNSRSKRLGDFAAGTIVVREGARGGVSSSISRSSSALSKALDASFGPSSAVGVSPPAAPILSAADATLVRDFLMRRERLDAPARAALARRLAHGLAERYGLQGQRDGRSDDDFLQCLIDR